MKKILSVLLATVLLFSCFSVGMISSAANITGEALTTFVNMLDEQTKILTTNVEDESGNITHYTPGYNFTNDFSTNNTFQGDLKLLQTLVNSYLPEFADCVDQDGNPDINSFVTKVAGFTASPMDSSNKYIPTVKPKSVIGSEKIGSLALKNMILDEDTITNASYTNSRDGGRKYSVSFNDFSYTPDPTDALAVGFDDSALPDLTDLCVSADAFKNLTDKINNLPIGACYVEKCNFNVTGLALEVVFSDRTDSADAVTSIKISYTIQGEFAINYMDETLKFVVGATPINLIYDTFKPFDANNDVDLYEFADIVNKATKNVNDFKAGYTSDKISDYTSTPELSFTSSILTTITSVLNPADKFKEAVSKAIDYGVASTVVKPTSSAKNDIDPKYAVKSTTIKASDFETLSYNPDTKLITFTLPNESNPDGKTSRISNFTNNYVNNEQLRKNFGINFSDEFGIPLISDTDLCTIEYKNIIGHLKFNNATADNMFGDGTLSSYSLKYDYEVNATVEKIKSVINVKANMNTANTNFKYVDYEYGDVDLSGKVALPDAKLLLKYLTGAVTLTDGEKKFADVNKDNKVNLSDAKQLLSVIVGNK